MQELAGRIDLERQPPFGEVDLDLVRALAQARADLGLVLRQEVVDELLAGVPGDPRGGVHQAQSRGRDDRLLDRHVSMAQGHIQVVVRSPCVAERAAGQSRHPAGVPGGERDPEAVGVGVRQPLHGIGPEILVLPLLSIGDDRRAGGLEPLDRIADRLLIERVESGVGAVPALGNRRDQGGRPGNAADWLAWDRQLNFRCGCSPPPIVCDVRKCVPGSCRTALERYASAAPRRTASGAMTHLTSV